MTEHQIKMQGFAFDPAELEIQPGDTVTWTNLDVGTTHNAKSADDASVEFQIDDVATNESKSHVFDDVSAGDSIPYLCTHHPDFMTGKLTVGA